jgi:membrane-bound ClpP family serine protease
MNTALIVLFIIVGIALLLLEIFFLPGLTIGGIAGALFIGAAVWITFATYGSATGFYTIFGIVVLFVLSLWIFIKAGVLERAALKTEVGSTVETEVTKIKVGQKGIALSRLAPIGNAEIDSITVEVKSIDGFIDQNSKIEVISTEQGEVSVKKIDN